MAGTIADLARDTLAPDFRNIDTHKTRVVLIEAGSRVLAGFPDDLSTYAQRSLEKLGVEVMLGEAVTECSIDGVIYGGKQLAARTIIWAAGVAASPAADWLGVAHDRAGRVSVNPDCTLPGHPEVFAIGDMVSLNKLPGVAQPAIQEGKYVAKVIKRRLAGETDIEPFKYFDKGSMATIGHKAAVADAFGRKFTGLPAYGMWLFIHVLYLIGWGNRLGTLYTWLRSLAFARNRANRVITFEQAIYEIEGDTPLRRRPPAILPSPEALEAAQSSTQGALTEPAPDPGERITGVDRT
jgi:NADH dehydrogenase